MSLSEGEMVVAMAKRRLLNALAFLAIGLAFLQAAAYLVVFVQQIIHPPVGKFVTVDGVRLHYLSEGSGPPVVFIHGNDGILQDFKLNILAAASKTYRAIAFDRPGHGYSQRESDKVATAEVQAQLIHDALRELGIEKPVIVGHSWGGALALCYALKYPADVSGIVLLSGVAYNTPETGGHAQDRAELTPVVGDLLISAFVLTQRPLVEVNADQVFFPAHAPHDYVDTYASLVVRPGQIKAYAQDETTLEGTLERNSPLYPSIKVPVVIVTGDQDSIVPPDLHAYPLHKAIPSSELIVIPGAGHQIELARVEPVIKAIGLAWRKAGGCAGAAPAGTSAAVHGASGQHNGSQGPGAGTGHP